MSVFQRLSKDKSFERLEEQTLKMSPFLKMRAETTMVPQSEKYGYHSLYFTKRNNQNKPIMVSIPREGRRNLATSHQTRDASPRLLMSETPMLHKNPSIENVLPELYKRSGTPDHIKQWRDELAAKAITQIYRLSKDLAAQEAIA